MPISNLRFIKRLAEFCPRDSSIKDVPKNTRGIYTLLMKRGDDYEVVYIGMSRGTKLGIHSRLNSHAKSQRKKPLWSHFSIYEVHDNVSEAEIVELEGLVRHVYRRDPKTNRIN